MSRTFIYSRVSTNEQTTDNQVLEISNRGYEVIPSRVVEEVISGSTCAMARPEFKNLVDNKLESGDTLVVLKLDRLGRDNIDIQQTINMLLECGIKVVSLDLPVSDLATSEGRLMLQLFSVFAEFERNRIVERTQEGLRRAKAAGAKLGRPQATGTTKRVVAAKEQGLTQSQSQAALGLSLSTIKRHWNAEL
ncbi:recombinase family protein [Oceanisphaera sp.]|uniref:recombinase family protein n=1 Tax=Oceanisphaera sp. TaxID=1929979 RepID=UPI003A932F0E